MHREIAEMNSESAQERIVQIAISDGQLNFFIERFKQDLFLICSDCVNINLQRSQEATEGLFRSRI